MVLGLLVGINLTLQFYQNIYAAQFTDTGPNAGNRQEIKIALIQKN